MQLTFMQAAKGLPAEDGSSTGRSARTAGSSTEEGRDCLERAIAADYSAIGNHHELRQECMLLPSCLAQYGALMYGMRAIAPSVLCHTNSVQRHTISSQQPWHLNARLKTSENSGTVQQSLGTARQWPVYMTRVCSGSEGLPKPVAGATLLEGFSICGSGDGKTQLLI
jgi:hypothetical protein